MSVKIHYLTALPKPVMGITHKAACQNAFRFSTGRQIRGTFNLQEVTCIKCLDSNVVKRSIQ